MCFVRYSLRSHILACCCSSFGYLHGIIVQETKQRPAVFTHSPWKRWKHTSRSTLGTTWCGYLILHKKCYLATSVIPICPSSGVLNSVDTETPVINYQSTLRNIPQARRSHLHSGQSGLSPKSRVCDCRNTAATIILELFVTDPR
jgi:hypothetical protein